MARNPIRLDIINANRQVESQIYIRNKLRVLQTVRNDGFLRFEDWNSRQSA